MKYFLPLIFLFLLNCQLPAQQDKPPGPGGDTPTKPQPTKPKPKPKPTQKQQFGSLLITADMDCGLYIDEQYFCELTKDVEKAVKITSDYHSIRVKNSPQNIQWESAVYLSPGEKRKITTDLKSKIVKLTTFTDEFTYRKDVWGSDYDNAITSRKIANGTLVFAHKGSKDWYSEEIEMDIGGEDCYSIDVRLRDLSGNSIVHGIRIGKFYFLISGSSYKFESLTSTWTSFIPWTTTTLLNSGTSYNKLSVKKSKTKFYLYINDSYLTEYSAMSLDYGKNKFGIGTNPGGKIEVDNMRVNKEADNFAAALKQYSVPSADFYDDFTSKRSEWKAEGDYDSYSLYVRNGVMKYSTKSSFDEDWITTFIGSADDFELEMKYRPSETGSDRVHSLRFGENYFSISGTQYCVQYWDTDNKKWLHAIDYTESSAILKGSVFTIMKVKKSGNLFYLYINGTYVNSIAAARLEPNSNRFGFGMNKYSTMEIEYFSVKQISASNYSTEKTDSFYDDFWTHNSSWRAVGDYDNYSMQLSGGTMKFSSKGGFMEDWTTLGIGSSDDFDVEMKCKITNGKNTFALRFGENYFFVSGDSYNLQNYNYTTNVWASAFSYTYSSAINTMGYYNIIRVKKTGSTFEFYINGTYVKSYSSMKLDYGENKFGFGINSYTTLEIDYFSVKKQ